MRLCLCTGMTHGVQINNGGGEKGNSEKRNFWCRVENRPHRAWKNIKKISLGAKKSKVKESDYGE